MPRFILAAFLRQGGFAMPSTYNVIRSTWLGGFVRSILSCCASSQPSAASRTLASASSRVAPCDQQPGKAGTCETKPDCSPGSVSTLNFMRQVYRGHFWPEAAGGLRCPSLGGSVRSWIEGRNTDVLNLLEEVLASFGSSMEAM